MLPPSHLFIPPSPPLAAAFLHAHLFLHLLFLELIVFSIYSISQEMIKSTSGSLEAFSEVKLSAEVGNQISLPAAKFWLER